MTLLDAVWEPEKVVVMHCQGHQRGRHPHPQARESEVADKAANHAAKNLGPLGTTCQNTCVLKSA